MNAPNKALQPTRAAERSGKRVSSRFGPPNPALQLTRAAAAIGAFRPAQHRARR